MKRVIYHIIIPSFLLVLFFAIAATPVEILGCRTRGSLALIIALISSLAALGAAIMGVKGGGMGGNASAHWWAASSIILVMPVIALFILA